MAYSVERTDTFEKSYDRALGYLAENLASPSAAKRLMSEIQRVADILQSTPYIKAVSSKPFLANNDLREYYLANYVIVYQVEGNVVTLINLFHQTQDYESPLHWAHARPSI